METETFTALDMYNARVGEFNAMANIQMLTIPADAQGYTVDEWHGLMAEFDAMHALSLEETPEFDAAVDEYYHEILAH